MFLISFLFCLMSIFHTRIQVDAQVNCSQYTNTITPSSTVSVSYVSTNMTISMQLKTSKQAWVALGRSKGGKMSGSEAVIGLPSAGTAGYYVLDGYSSSNVNPSSAVTLSDSSITQSSSDGTTILKFTQKLSEGRFPLSSTSSATFIYAIGCNNNWGNTHCSEGSFTVKLSPCGTNSTSSSTSSHSSLVNLKLFSLTLVTLWSLLSF